MHQTAVTPDRKPVVSCYDMVGTHGLPIETVLELCKERGLVVDWLTFWKDGLAEGRNPYTFLNQIAEALREIHGTPYAEEVIRRLKYCWVAQSGKVA